MSDMQKFTVTIIDAAMQVLEKRVVEYLDQWGCCQLTWTSMPERAVDFVVEEGTGYEA